jgi:hypothetical protein
MTNMEFQNLPSKRIFNESKVGLIEVLDECADDLIRLAGFKGLLESR